MLRQTYEYIDNESAMASLIRGATDAPDARALVEAIHVLQLRLDCRLG